LEVVYDSDGLVKIDWRVGSRERANIEKEEENKKWQRYCSRQTSSTKENQENAQ
jgi:hypothetical protein